MTVDRTKVNPGHKDLGILRAKLPVYDSGSDTGNAVLTMDHPMRELYVSNDDLSNDLTLLVSGPAGLSISMTLKPNETIDERFPEFDAVTITATGAWRYYVRSGLVP